MIDRNCASIGDGAVTIGGGLESQRHQYGSYGSTRFGVSFQ